MLALLCGCPSSPLPALRSAPADGAGMDGPVDLVEDIPSALAGPILLATGIRPLLGGVTEDGEILAYSDGTDQYVVPTYLGPARLLLNQGRDATGAVLSNNVVLSLYDYRDGASRLKAWAKGDGVPEDMSDRAYSHRAALAASPDGRLVAYVHVNGDTGDIRMRRRDLSRPALSPDEMKGIDLFSCLTELRFYDETRLVAFYCSKAAQQPRVVVVDAERGGVLALSDEASEVVDQVHFVPKKRILWVNKLRSAKDPGTLKSATSDGAVRQVVATGVPGKAQAQLTLSPSGDLAFYLDNSGMLMKIATTGGTPQRLTHEKVSRIVAVSPDGGVIGITRGAPRAPERLFLIDTNTGTEVEASGEGEIKLLVPGLFSGDSGHAFYVTDTDMLSAFPARGPMGAQRVPLVRRALRGLPLSRSNVLALHEDEPGMTIQGSVIDASKVPPTIVAKDRGLDASPSGTWLVTPDRGKLVYIKGVGIYATPVP